MSKQDITTRIQSELAALVIEEANLNHKYKNKYHSGEGTFDLLPDMERVHKRQIELEDALRVMGEFK